MPIKSIISGIHEANIAYEERRIKNIRNRDPDCQMFSKDCDDMSLNDTVYAVGRSKVKLSELISKLSKVDKGMASMRLAHCAAEYEGTS